MPHSNRRNRVRLPRRSRDEAGIPFEIIAIHVSFTGKGLNAGSASIVLIPLLPILSRTLARFKVVDDLGEVVMKTREQQADVFLHGRGIG
jgi:hypothetical protein